MGGDPNLARQLIEVVADREDCTIFDLEERLYEAVDPVEVARLEHRETDERLGFTYHGYDVVVDTDSRIRIEPAAAGAADRRQTVKR
jgi:hypothetical protein